jgi:nitrogen fixation-related uncharacterized protein
MSVPPEALVLLGVAICGAALALAGFVWAVSHGQLDSGSAGSRVIFEEEDKQGGRQ